jgi:hypothetical protein
LNAPILCRSILIPFPILIARSVAALLVGSCLVACGGTEDDQPRLPPDELANRVEVLRTATTEEELRPPRLGRLTPADVGTRFRGRPSCRLEWEGKTLLVAKGPSAVARIDNELRLLAAAGPVASSGAYFEAPGVTVSIGRRATVAPAADEPGIAWPAGVTIGGTEDRPIEKRDAQWRCLT